MSEATTKTEQESTTNIKVFDYLIKVLPVFTAIFIFFGAVKNIFYYNLFSINILNFINTTEFLKLFMYDVFTFSLIPVYIISLFYYSFLKDIKRDKATAKPHDIVKYTPQNVFIKKREKIKESKWLNRIRFVQWIFTKVLLFIWWFIQLILMISMIVGIQSFVQSFKNLIIYSVVAVCYFITLAYSVTFRKIYKFLSPNINEKSIGKIDLFMYLIILLIINTFLSAYLNYYQINKWKENRNISLVIQNKDTIPAFGSIYCIGMTDNYVFIQDEKSWKSKIYKRSDITEIDYMYKPKSIGLFGGWDLANKLNSDVWSIAFIVIISMLSILFALQPIYDAIYKNKNPPISSDQEQNGT